jgi:hypothetical protein
MLRHIVMWKLRDEQNGRNKAENARHIQSLLHGLRGQIDGLLAIDVGIQQVYEGDAEQLSDVVLIADFVDTEALKTYHHHPAHQAVLPLIGELRTERRVVDYFIDDTNP